MTDERIYQLMELARSYRLEGGMKLNLARLVEEEVRKEQAEKIAELERQLKKSRKLIEEAPTFFAPEYGFEGRKLAWIRSAAIAAKEVK